MMNSSIIYLKVKGCDIHVRLSGLRPCTKHADAATCSHYNIWYVVVPRPLNFLGLGTTFWMYHRVYIKRVPKRLLCRLDVASSL